MPAIAVYQSINRVVDPPPSQASQRLQENVASRSGSVFDLGRPVTPATDMYTEPKITHKETPTVRFTIRWHQCLLSMLLLGHLPASLAAVSLPFNLVPAFIALSPMTLAPAEQQWLARHRTLKVGISIDDYQPIDITRDRNRYQGISADYLSLVGARLGVPMQVMGFAERAQAVEALRAGSIDILTSANGY